MSTSMNPIGSAAAAGLVQAGTASDAGAGQVVSKDTFLKLLVAQIRNQNPLNPTDSTQFVTQLAQFSELEQVMGVRADLDAIRQSLTKALSDNTTSTP